MTATLLSFVREKVLPKLDAEAESDGYGQRNEAWRLRDEAEELVGAVRDLNREQAQVIVAQTIDEARERRGSVRDEQVVIALRCFLEFCDATGCNAHDVLRVFFDGYSDPCSVPPVWKVKR